MTDSYQKNDFIFYSWIQGDSIDDDMYDGVRTLVI